MASNGKPSGQPRQHSTGVKTAFVAATTGVCSKYFRTCEAERDKIAKWRGVKSVATKDIVGIPLSVTLLLTSARESAHINLAGVR